MSDLIRREDVVKLILARYENPEICEAEINRIPTVDVVPVIHCKECRYWKDRKVGLPDGTERDYRPGEEYFVELSTGINIGCHCTLHGFENESGSWFWAQPDDFCSRGKRKDGEK